MALLHDKQELPTYLPCYFILFILLFCFTFPMVIESTTFQQECFLFPQTDEFDFKPSQDTWLYSLAHEIFSVPQSSGSSPKYASWKQEH